MSFSLFSLTIYLLIVAIGFMMGYLFKHTHTSARFFSPHPNTTLRLYILTLITAITTLYALSYFTSFSLTPVTIPEDNLLRYERNKSIMIFALNFFFLMLVVLSNIYSQASHKLILIPYLLTAAFYCLFVLKDVYHVSGYYLLWMESLKMLNGDAPPFSTTGWIKCLLGVTVTALNALIVWWSLKK